MLAKEVATSDVLSAGRVMLGVGSGYLEPEFRAVGADFENRGAVTDEYLDAMAALWYDERPAYHGRFVNFEGIDAHPRPWQRPIPLIVGGHHPPAFRRAASRAHGWYGYWLSPEQTADALTGLRAAADRVGRRSDLGELKISVTPNARLTPALVEAYAGAGVHRLVPFAPPTADGPARTIEVAAAAARA